MESTYNTEFYNLLEAGARQSASEIIPLVLELIQPQSIIDIGCGSGTWLSVFQELGTQEYLGIDGDYVGQDILQIPPENFLARDIKFPLNLNRTFDLVMSLEVAEHLESEHADVFIDSLTELGAVILFSAAIPHQRGVNHVNEQWPDYWISHFKKRGYLVIDCLRKQVWNNERVEPWYAQNIFIFVKQTCLEQYPSLQREFEQTQSQIAIVHPKIYLQNLPAAHPTVCTSVDVKLNDNRCSSLELGITAVYLLNLTGETITEINSGDPLRIVVDYMAHHSISDPIFSMTISHEDGLICYDTNTQAAALSLPLIQGCRRITLQLERLDLNSGQYFVDVGVYEQSWACVYDYHWHVHPLVIRTTTSEKGILRPPHHWISGG